MKRALILITVILTLFAQASAQRYVLDDNFPDSVNVYNINCSKDKLSETAGKIAMKLPLGDTVTVERTLKGNSTYGLVRIEGKEYAIASGDLLFCDNNPEGVTDTFGNTRDRVNHSFSGKLFATFTPYAIVAILFIVAVAFTMLGLKKQQAKRLALMVVPACVLVASLIEIWAFQTLGTSAFWWCSYDRYGFFGSLFRALPFVGIVALQIYSIKPYKRLIVGKDSEEELSIKPMAISLAICIPVTLIVVCLSAVVLKFGSTTTLVLTIVAFLASLAIGIVMSLRKNIKMLGKSKGIIFTVFGIVYVIGSLIALYGLILVIIDLIIQILIIVAGFFAVGFAMSGGSGSSSSQPTYTTRTVYLDDDGNRYNTEVDAQEANKKIAERKLNNQ